MPVRDFDEGERAFTDEEMGRLLAGGAERSLMDLMLVAALSGARLEALVDLRVRDTVDGGFRFKGWRGKHVGVHVPIHPALRGIVERRTAGKEPYEPFFPEWGEGAGASPLRAPSSEASRRFTQYRYACEVHEIFEGRRRSFVNFGSFRRWFVTQVANNGVSGVLFNMVTGHRGPEMAFARSFVRYGWEDALQCVAAVTLPRLHDDVRPLPRKVGLAGRVEQAVP